MRKVLIAFAIGTSVVIGVFLWVGGGHGESAPDFTTKVDQREVPVQRPAYPIKPAPAVHLADSDAQELHERYVGLGPPSGISDRTMTMLSDGVCAYQYLYDRDTRTFIDGHFGTSLDIPKVEFRFRRPGGDGELVPCAVRSITFRPIWNGELHEHRDCEVSGFGFQGAMGGASYDWVHAVRALLSDTPDSGVYHSLIFGQKYYVKMFRPGYEGPEKTPHLLGMAVITIPENVPPGKMAVIELDATKRTDPFNLYGPINKQTIRVRVQAEPPKRPAYVMLSDPGANGLVRSADLGPDGTAELTARQLGGEMIVAVGGEEDGFILYYKKEIEGTEVNFPTEADVSVSPQDVVNFRLKVPEERVPYDSLGIGLVMKKDSTLQVGGMEFANVQGWTRSSKTPPKLLPMKAAPGTYYVVCGTDHKLIGRITVRESAAGKTLEIKSVEE